MGGAGPTDAAQAATVGRDGLLATKLHAPRPRPGFLPRPRLLGRLAEGAGRELVLVCTPAGFGKTTLLGDWARRSRQPVAWTKATTTRATSRATRGSASTWSWRVLLAERTPDRALPLLERLHHLAVAQERLGSRIEVRVLQSLALAAGDEEAGALDALAEALALAWPEGYLRVFVDEGTPMADLLGKLVASGRRQPAPAGGVPPTYLRQLPEAFEQDAAAATVPARHGAAAAVPRLAEPLSDREREVLALLAAGRSNQQIANELFLALDTVKKHVSHILDKLGAGNRTQAVTRARELGQVP
jgi:ATP/maltotriose-dependent transcriptional regulator MalT